MKVLVKGCEKCSNTGRIIVDGYYKDCDCLYEHEVEEGDIFFWSWKEDFSRQNDGYWCKSRKAIADTADSIHDNFWFSSVDGFRITENNKYKVDLIYKGNLKDFKIVHKNDYEKYAEKDIIDMRNSNGCKDIYVRKDAKYSDQKILEKLNACISEAESNLRSATYDLERAVRMKDEYISGERSPEHLYF